MCIVITVARLCILWVFLTFWSYVCMYAIAAFRTLNKIPSHTSWVSRLWLLPLLSATQGYKFSISWMLHAHTSRTAIGQLKKGRTRKRKRKMTVPRKKTRGIMNKELEAGKEALSHSANTYNNTSFTSIQMVLAHLQIHVKIYATVLCMHTMCMYTCISGIM